MRALVGVAFVTAIVSQPSAQSSITPADAAIIDAALQATAVLELERFKKQTPALTMTIVDRSVAVCPSAQPQTFCLDAAIRTLDVLVKRGAWPGDSIEPLKIRNGASVSLASQPLTSGAFVPAGTRSSAKEGRAVAQVSLPATFRDQAIVIVLLSYAGSQSWGVLLQRDGNAWKVINSQHLMSGG